MFYLKTDRDARTGGTREDEIVDTIVVHAISEFIEIGDPMILTSHHDEVEKAMYCIDFLRSRNLGAHYFITPSGDLILERDPRHIVWHARRYNERSIGIECMVPGIHTYQSFTAKMVYGPHADSRVTDTLVDLIGELVNTYPIKQIRGHYEIDPKRKTDPGEYINMDLLRDRLSWKNPDGVR